VPFDDRLKNTQTPHRVYALCRLVQYKRLKKDELQRYLFPPTLNKNDDVFRNVYSLAKDNLIQEDPDGIIKLILTEEDIKSPEAFRRAIARKVFSDHQLTFSRFTAWFINRGAQIYREKPPELVASFDKEINVNKDINMYNETNINGWRTWVSFLGLGFSHNGIVVPNATVRLEDVLLNDNQLQRNKPIPFKDFMSWLSVQCPELDYGVLSRSHMGQASRREQHLSLTLSAGLRGLHDNGKIQLKYVRDAQDIWHLSAAHTHEINGPVSEIMIRRWQA